MNERGSDREKEGEGKKGTCSGGESGECPARWRKGVAIREREGRSGHERNGREGARGNETAAHAVATAPDSRAPKLVQRTPCRSNFNGG